jgi:hypothetical protein
MGETASQINLVVAVVALTVRAQAAMGALAVWQAAAAVVGHLQMVLRRAQAAQAVQGLCVFIAGKEKNGLRKN